MTYAEIQETILTCISSKSLKQAIKDRKLLFEYSELLTVAYRYARSFGERLRFLSLLGEHADAETAEAAKRILAHQKGLYERFVTPCSGEVYELVVGEKNDFEHRVLCASFEMAMRLRGKFFAEYFGEDEEERAAAHSAILRRRIARDAENMDCRFGADDEVFRCRLTADGEIRDLSDDQYGVCPDGVDRSHLEDEDHDACEVCGRICPEFRAVPFPVYLQSGDLIRWTDITGKETIGVWLKTDSSAPDDNVERYYALDLMGKSMQNRIWQDPERRYDVFFTAHEHPLAPEAEKAELSELDENTREVYEDFMRFYEEYERERETEKQKGESES